MKLVASRMRLGAPRNGVKLAAAARSCGVTTHWQSLDGSRDRMAINARLIDGLNWDVMRIRQFDGADTWTYLDED